MPGKKVIVVGAGVSGLATAARLQKSGYSVRIYEKNGGPGGRMGLIQGQGFSFDLGPTIVMMPQIYREVFEFCGVNPDDYIPMERLDPIYSVYFTDGTVHQASSELTKLTQSLEEVSFRDAQGYLGYLADIYQRYLVAKDHFIMRAFRKPTDFYNPKTLAAAVRLKTFNNAYKSISKFVKDEKLRELLSFQTLYIGISPFNGPSIYTIIPMIELIYGVWFIKGGMHAMASGLERLFKELGGEIHYDMPVEKIIVENGKASGVIVGGASDKADYVVTSADFPYVLEEMLPKPFKQGKYQSDKTDKLAYSCSCMMLYLGLDKKDFPGLNVHNLAFSGDFEGNIRDVFEGRFPEDPSLYVYAPGLLDPSLAPEGSLGLYVLAPVPNLKDGDLNWKEPDHLEEYKKVIYERMERISPLKGFKEHVVFEKLLTPKDFEEQFNARFGATFGLKPTLLQSNYFRPQPKAAQCEGLYFTGSSVHPGAGVPIVLTSAKLAVEELIKDDQG